MQTLEFGKAMVYISRIPCALTPLPCDTAEIEGGSKRMVGSLSVPAIVRIPLGRSQKGCKSGVPQRSETGGRTGDRREVKAQRGSKRMESC